MTERVGVRNVAIDAADLAAAKLAHHGRVEIDDQDLAQEILGVGIGAVVLELVEDGAGVTEEAEKDDGLLPLLALLFAGRRDIQVLDPDQLQHAAHRLLNSVARVDHVGREDRSDRERDDHDGDDIGWDLLARETERRDHDRELAHLREVDCR